MTEAPTMTLQPPISDALRAFLWECFSSGSLRLQSILQSARDEEDPALWEELMGLVTVDLFHRVLLATIRDGLNQMTERGEL